jgi:protease II
MLNQQADDIAPRLLARTTTEQARPLFSFETVFRHFQATYLKGIRFSHDSAQGLALLGTPKGSTLITFDPYSTQWQEIGKYEPLDYRYLSHDMVALLLHENETLSLQVLGLSRQPVTIPRPCIHGTLLPLTDTLIAVQCNTGTVQEWWTYDVRKEKLTAVDSEGKLVSLAGSNNMFFALSRVDDESYRLTLSSSLSPTPDDDYYDFSNGHYPEELISVPSGILARVRHGFFYYYMLFTNQEGALHAPTTIRQEDCSLFHEPYIGAISSITFRCETPVSREGTITLDLSSGAISQRTKENHPPQASITTTLEFAESDDGTSIPITIFHSPTHRKIHLPTLILSYGSYGHMFPSHFQPLLSHLIGQGFIIAIPHIRGSGFYGEKWHQAAKGRYKYRTVADIAAAITHLKRKFPERNTIGIGKSAGAWPFLGMLSSCSTNVDALLLEMPLVDPVLQISESDPYWPQERHEWGELSERSTQEVYAPFTMKHWKQPLPSFYIRVGKNDSLLSSQILEDWIHELLLQFPDISLHIDIGENTGHFGAFDAHDELYAQAHQASFLYSVIESLPTKQPFDTTNDMRCGDIS